MAFKRLPNGVGTVTKEKGKRRNPWRAMKPVGKKVSSSGKVYVEYKRIGSYATRSEAVKALMDYDDIPVTPLTFDDVYQKWAAIKKPPLTASKKSAYKHLKQIYHRKIAELKTLDLEHAINREEIPRTMKVECVTILHGVFDYALRHEYIDKDYSKLAQYDLDSKTRIKRSVFTKDEIDALWKKKEGFYESALLILLYTGLRISELGNIRNEDIHLDEHYMVGGMKTEAGTNRIIPIHSDIRQLIASRINDGTYLYTTERGTKLIEHNMRQFLLKNNIPHTPHDTRHTYASQAYLCGMDENITKRILGHSLPGITQQVYIHLTPADIVQENEKLHF